MRRNRPRLVPWRKLTRDGQRERMRWLSNFGLASPEYRLYAKCSKLYRSKYNTWVKATNDFEPWELADERF